MDEVREMLRVPNKVRGRGGLCERYPRMGDVFFDAGATDYSAACRGPVRPRRALSSSHRSFTG